MSRPERVGHARRVGAWMWVAGVAGLVIAASAAAAPNTWAVVGPLSAARLQPVMAALPSGKVLLAGGVDARGVSLATTEIYDPSKGTWSAGPDMTEPRDDASAVLLKNGDVLVVGGLTNTAPFTTATAELYEPTTNTFTATGSLNEARTSAGIALLPDGEALVIGGFDDGPGGVLANTEVYDPTSGTFASGPAMHDRRENPMVTVLSSGAILAAGGDDAVSPLDTAEVLNPQGVHWTATHPMSDARQFGGIARLPDGRALVAGGDDASSTGTDTTDIYDPTTNAFSPGPAMAHPRAGFGTVALSDGTIMVAGGTGQDPQNAGAAGLSSTEIYNPAAGTWSSASDLPSGIDEPAMVQFATGEVLEAAGTADGVSVSAQTAVFDAPIAPSAPAQVAATPGDHSALVTWTTAAANGSPVTSYTVTSSTGQVVTLTGAITSTTVSNLTNGTPVTFTVKATNAKGTSPASVPSPPVTPTASSSSPPSSPPSPPPSPPPATPPAGTAAPDKPATLKLAGLASRSTLKKFLAGLRFTVAPSKAVALQITLTGTTSRAVIGRFNLALASKRFGLSAAKRAVRLVPSRKLVGHPRSAKVQLTVVAVDAAGTRSTVTRTLTLTR